MAETTLKFKLSGYNSSDGTTGTTPQVVPFDTFETFSSGLSYSNSGGELTINDAGNYLITADVTTFQDTGNNRDECRVYLEVDTGSGFSEIAGTVGRNYSRQTAYGENTATIRASLAISAGDKIRVMCDSQGSRTQGGQANGCRIQFVLVDATEAPSGGLSQEEVETLIRSNQNRQAASSSTRARPNRYTP